MEIINSAPITPEVKEILLSELPHFMENIDEAADKIFNPSSVWFEAIQFADYVEQNVQHLQEGHGEDCQEEIIERLLDLTTSFKALAEHSMRVLDESEQIVEFKHGPQQ